MLNKDLHHCLYNNQPMLRPGLYGIRCVEFAVRANRACPWSELCAWPTEGDPTYGASETVI